MSVRKWLPHTTTAVSCLSAMLLFANPAYAAPTKCITNQESDGAQIVPANGAGYLSRAVVRQRAKGTWQDFIWRGELKPCPKGGTKQCELTWGVNKITTSGWSIGGAVGLGNASSPSKKWYNMVLAFLPSYQKITTVETNFNWAVTVLPGHTAQPVQVVTRRRVQGDFVGGWSRTGSGCPNGKTYQWQPNLRWGNWTENQKQSQVGTIAVDGKI